MARAGVTSECPALLATAKRSKTEVAAVDGPTTAGIIAELYEMNDATKDKLRKILLPKSGN